MKRRMFRPSTTRMIQIGILFLLVITAAQVLWWYIDQTRYTNEIRQRMLSHYSSEIRVADEMLLSGESVDRLARLFPHLAIEQGAFVLSEEALQALEGERARRLNMFRWEGGFFFVVLLACMAVLWKALYEDSLLRKRQQTFVASVSHEFKSPLASLQLTAETLSMRELPPERSSELVNRMLSDIRRMEDMVSKILDATRIEQGRLPLNPERVPLTRAMTAMLVEYKERAHEQQVELKASDSEELDIYADGRGVRTVIRNLIDNAVKSTAIAGGGTVTVSIARQGAYVELCVSDDGHGFLQQESTMLFKKFYRPGDELCRKGPGTGLGLFIVERFMHLEKGRVKAHSDGPGKGAVFTVSWPAIRGESS
jgi:signal transduction histidine kinase